MHSKVLGKIFLGCLIHYFKMILLKTKCNCPTLFDALRNALLLQSLQSFENAFVADQEQMKQVVERRAVAEKQAAEKQAQDRADKQEQERILAQKLLSPLLT